MPLRVRLIVLVGAVLVASLACGSVLVAWHAAKSVRTEMNAALDVGTKTIRNGLDDLARGQDRATELRRLIATFNGNRHVRAMLLDEREQTLAASVLLAPKRPGPDWFRRLIAAAPGAVRLAVPQPRGGGTVVLRADPANEVAEVWGESRDAVAVLAAFALLTALLVHIAVGRALRPLQTLSVAFRQIGDGHYGEQLAEQGPPELTHLARGFNLMTQRLATAAIENRRLNERLLTLQQEERADLARDLHDEVGPLLFAVDMTAATIGHLAAGKRGEEIPVHVRSIQDAVGRVQRHVRGILERLRPLRALGLEAAIERLVAFWRTRRPDITFSVTVSIEQAWIGEDMKETIYRVVQEGLSNAVRHGEPTHVAVAVGCDGDGGIRIEVTDDGIGMPADGAIGPGFGLVGMRERVMAMAGSLTIQHGSGRRGLTLVARLPAVSPLQSFGSEAAE